ncbi:MAG: hypothetical protein EPN88_05520, partial [Bacteroidetes bacterium]
MMVCPYSLYLRLADFSDEEEDFEDEDFDSLLGVELLLDDIEDPDLEEDELLPRDCRSALLFTRISEGVFLPWSGLVIVLKFLLLFKFWPLFLLVLLSMVVLKFRLSFRLVLFPLFPLFSLFPLFPLFPLFTLFPLF